MWTDNNCCLQINGVSCAGAFNQIWKWSAKFFSHLSDAFDNIRCHQCSWDPCDVVLQKEIAMCLAWVCRVKQCRSWWRRKIFHLQWVITQHENLSWSCWAQKQGILAVTKVLYVICWLAQDHSTDLKTALHKSEPPRVS